MIGSLSVHDTKSTIALWIPQPPVTTAQSLTPGLLSYTDNKQIDKLSPLLRTSQ